MRDRKEKILYFEGEPRFEYKFIRRAIPEGDNIIVTSLIRTADNKYMRQGVDGPDELVAAFPKTREELFAYRSLIIGSLEAAALTGDQLKMIAEFVDRRGGGLLMLGGPRAFAEGGWTGTAVADVLPVVLDRNKVQAEGHRDAATDQADPRRRRHGGDAARRERRRRPPSAGTRCRA